MRFQVEASAFREAVSAAASVIVRSHAPVMECVLISAADGVVRVTGSRHEVSAYSRCDASVSAPGAACINAEILKAALRGTYGYTTVCVEGGMASISGGVDAQLPTMIATKFPTLDKPTVTKELSITPDLFRAACALASRDETRQHQQGICLQGDRMMAFGGPTVFLSPITDGSGEILTQDVAKHFKDGTRLFVSDTHWRVEGENLSVIGRTMEGVFPNHEALVTSDEFLIRNVDMSLVVGALKSVAFKGARQLCVEAGSSLTLTGTGDGGARISRSLDVSCDFSARAFVKPELLLRAFSAIERPADIMFTDQFVAARWGETLALTTIMRHADASAPHRPAKAA